MSHQELLKVWKAWNKSHPYPKHVQPTVRELYTAIRVYPELQHDAKAKLLLKIVKGPPQPHLQAFIRLLKSGPVRHNPVRALSLLYREMRPFRALLGESPAHQLEALKRHPAWVKHWTQDFDEDPAHLISLLQSIALWLKAIVIMNQALSDSS